MTAPTGTVIMLIFLHQWVGIYGAKGGGLTPPILYIATQKKEYPRGVNFPETNLQFALKKKKKGSGWVVNEVEVTGKNITD